MLHTDAREVFRKGEAGGLMEHAGEMRGADAAGAGGFGEGAASGEGVRAQMPARAVREGGERALLLHELRHGEDGEVFRHGGNNAREGLGGGRIERRTGGEQAAVLFFIEGHTGASDQVARAAQGAAGDRTVSEPGEEKEADGLPSELQRNRDLVESGVASAGGRLFGVPREERIAGAPAEAASGLVALHQLAEAWAAALRRHRRAELVEQMERQTGQGLEVAQERTDLGQPQETLEQCAMDDAGHT